MSAELDRRLNAFRPDLADVRLEGKVTARRFVAGVAMRVCAPVAPMHREPRPDCPRDTEALFGDDVLVFEREEGWAWCQSQRDGYVGYMPDVAVTPASSEAPTHGVTALGGALVFAGPDIKSQLLMRLPLNARLSVTEIGDGFARLGGAVVGFVRLQQIEALASSHNRDFVAVAESFAGTPYLWGGCTRDGIDCSGLVQMALMATGVSAPRDSDMQAANLGRPLPIETTALAALDTPDGGAAAAPERGDLVFWRGHVGMMVDATTLLHANAHHMQVMQEPLADVLARNQSANGGAVSCIRRLVR